MRFLLVSLVIILTSSFAYSASWIVPDDFSTIQGAINASSGGDTVIVRPGTYMENIDFDGKAIIVASEQGPIVTLIDGNQGGSVVTFRSGEGPGSILDGFTITNGSAIYGGGIYCNLSSPTIRNNTISGNSVSGGPYRHGGGLYCRKCSPTITNNTFSGNTASGEGGGMIFVMNSHPKIEENTITNNWAELWGGGIEYFDSCSPTIINNIITNNTVSQYGGGGIALGTNCSGTIINNTISGNTVGKHGAGIFCEQNSSPTIKGNTFSANTANGEGAAMLIRYGSSPCIDNNIITSNWANRFGGGIECWKDCDPTITNNIITNNTVSQYDGGGIVVANNCAGIIQNNIIAGNSAGRSGGAVLCETISTPILTNNTIYDNSAVTAGGAIACTTGSSMKVVNTILWNNDAPKGPAIWIGEPAFPSSLTIGYSNVDGGKVSVFVEQNCTLTWDAGMINAAPKFVDAVNGDYHLTYPSPCKDSGDNTIVTELTDFEDDPRIAFGTVDMGADEFYTHLYWTGNATPGGNVELKFIGLPGTSPVGLFIGSGVLDPALPSMWGDWYLKFPIFGPLDLGSIPSPEGVLIVQGAIPNTPPAPYSVPMQALIGMKLSNLCVLEVK